MITDHVFRHRSKVTAARRLDECVFLGTCGRPAEEHLPADVFRRAWANLGGAFSLPTRSPSETGGADQSGPSSCHGTCHEL